MLRLGDVVIRMKKLPKHLVTLVGSDNFDQMPKLKPIKPFDGKVIKFFNELSKNLINNPSNRDFPDVVTFGFFSRKSNINQLKKDKFLDFLSFTA